ncbi:MAG TPA: RsmE family RNA methyltransferase [Candidatus Babeliales bacterium]|nr:RsmE family RNA methyltransferase [Candidatus Babeliales bacterium]
MNIDSAHQFACYHASLSSILSRKIIGQTIQLEDPTLAHRIYTILRMEAGDAITLFDCTHHIVLELHKQPNKKSIAGIVRQQERNVPLSPEILILLPVLKRDALQDALYTCVELGATTIQLVLTTKTHAIRYDATMAQRLQAIAVSAAEQSKQFIIPTILSPIPLSQAIEQLPAHTNTLCFHPNGQSITSIFTNLNRSNPITITFGPEGDFTETETVMLQNSSFQFYRLTPTVLRSQQALTVALGIVRSIV